MKNRKQLYWEDVETGQTIPTEFTINIDTTRLVLQVSGTQDYYPVHHDIEFAHAQGAPDPFVNTGFLTAALGRLIYDWISPEGFLKKFRLELRKMNLLGDKMSVKGKVTDKFKKDGENFVTADIWCETVKMGITAPCKATIVLPSCRE